MLMGKHSHFTPQKNPTWKEANRKGRVRANPRFLSTVPNKRGAHDTQCNYSCKKPILPEMLGDREMGGPHPSKEDSPSDPCSRAPSLTQTQTKLPTVHFHPAPYLQPQKNKGNRAFSTFHSAWLFQAPGIRPCTAFALSCHRC